MQFGAYIAILQKIDDIVVHIFHISQYYRKALLVSDIAAAVDSTHERQCLFLCHKR